MSTGFHFVIGHGVTDQCISSTFDAARRFHDLPEDVKRDLAMDSESGRAGVGYLAEKHTKLPARDRPNMNSSFVVKNECGPRQMTLDRMPWPDEEVHTSVSGFRGCVTRYCSEMEALAKRMLPIYAVALGLDPDYFSDAFTEPLFRLRLSKYAQTAAGEYGINPHVDTSFFTILRATAPGLVIQLPHAAGWARVPQMGKEDAFIVNFGQLLRQVTNDSWPATRHYVLNHVSTSDPNTHTTHDHTRRQQTADSTELQTDERDELRFALPFFFNANPMHQMAVVPTCCSDTNPPKYPPLSYLDGQGVAQGE